MKNKWTTFFLGRVLIRLEGRGIERLLNKFTQAGISTWNIKRKKSGAVYFFIALPDLHKVRKAVRNSDCTISFKRGEGVPFLWKRALQNSGFLVGILFFFLVAGILSNITWGIQVEGADPETEHQIRKELATLGVKVGTPHIFSDRPNMIQKKLTEKIDNITWIGVELKGTTYQFQVVQKTEPKQQVEKSPGHLVASKKAVISHMFVERGKPMVKINQFVDKGQLLVSGAIGKEEEEMMVVAEGKVWGKTWYKTTVEFPLDSSLRVFTGKEKKKHALVFGKFSLPVWGFGKADYTQSETEIEKHDLFFLGWKLPFDYAEITTREKENYQRSLSEEEAIAAAKKFAREDIKKHIPVDAKIDEEYILQEKVENGKVKLTINFQVIENIAEEKPIIQGD
nr:sporulation protein YqfD [Paenibacillus bovis]